MNKKLHTFAMNFKKVYGGANTVVAQLRHYYTVPRRAAHRGKRANSPNLSHYSPDTFFLLTEYSDKVANEELPLGEEFQNFIHCFVDQNTKDPKMKYALAGKLMEQLT